jgi:hypothetical protein
MRLLRNVTLLCTSARPGDPYVHRRRSGPMNKRGFTQLHVLTRSHTFSLCTPNSSAALPHGPHFFSYTRHHTVRLPLWPHPGHALAAPPDPGPGQCRHEGITFLTAGSPRIASVFHLPLCHYSSNWFGADGAMIEILRIALLLSVFYGK